jgi:hypothetical protein
LLPVRLPCDNFMGFYRRNELVPEVHDGASEQRLTPRAADAASARSRLNELARRDPDALLGVLGFWLAPQPGESESRADR